MTRNGVLDDLSAFAAVAKARSFTRAAKSLGISTSTLSYIIKRLEARLSVVLLQRTSRSVAPTEAGVALLATLVPALSSIDDALSALSQTNGEVLGTVRLTATRQSYDAVIRPLIAEFSAIHPGTTLEVFIDYALNDIVADGFDAGIRVGENLEQDMVALKVGPDLRMAVVAAPRYLETAPHARTPEDLQSHRCINYRMVVADSVYAWEFEKDGQALRVRVPGPLIFNEPELMLAAAREGLGITYVLEHEARPYIERGELVQLLGEWTPPFPGFYLYYPSKRRVAPAFAALLTLLRARQNSRRVATSVS